MVPNPLDNPIWASLATSHREIALGIGDILRYPADVAPFLGISKPGIDAADLAKLVDPGETLFLIGQEPVASAGWKVTNLGSLVQMVFEGPMPEASGPQVVPLGEEHRAAVLELTGLVYPHYFRSRTMELGRYFGIFKEERLAAVIGERMGMPGFREISAVCTHPDFAGRGYARTLLVYLVNDILAGGNMPFLHASPANFGAIRLYEQTGFRTRSSPAFWSLSRNNQI